MKPIEECWIGSREWHIAYAENMRNKVANENDAEYKQYILELADFHTLIGKNQPSMREQKKNMKEAEKSKKEPRRKKRNEEIENSEPAE